jgi:hypothetical protein
MRQILANRTQFLYNRVVNNQDRFTLNHPGWFPELARPLGNQVLLVVAPHAANPLMLELAARLAVDQPMRVLDGGNRFNVYPVAKAVRRRTARLEEALGRITLSRAFTCYQLQAQLEESPNSSDPTLLLDMLSTFLDESVPLPESRRLLGKCLPHLHRLASTAPLVVSAKPMTPLSLERQVLLDMLQVAADQCWVLEPVPEVKRQMELNIFL